MRLNRAEAHGAFESHDSDHAPKDLISDNYFCRSAGVVDVDQDWHSSTRRDDKICQVR